MAIDLSWQNNRQSLISIISFIVFMAVMNAMECGSIIECVIIGGISGAVVWGGLSWLLNKILSKPKK